MDTPDRMPQFPRTFADVPLALRYILFCLAATVVNLGTQAAAPFVYSGTFALTIAMLLGTGGGLVAKYIFDKYWIFADPGSGLGAHSRQFSLYAATGVLTTGIFWSLEYLFDSFSPDGRYRFAGALIGLALGYALKYRLDRRFVFAEPPA